MTVMQICFVVLFFSTQAFIVGICIGSHYLPSVDEEEPNA